MARIPKHRRRVDGRSVVTLNGQDFYFPDPPGTPAADAWYARTIAEWLGNQQRVIPRGRSLTVAELAAAYLASDAASDSRDTRAVPHLTTLYGSLCSDSFGPTAFRAVRQRMIDAGWNRREVNKCADRIKRIFRWGVGQELVPPAVLQTLAAVDGLRRGRTTAPEPAKVRPVAESGFRAALPHLSPALRAVAELQWWTGARSGEVLQLRPMDVDCSVAVWLYRPRRHKTEAYGERVIFLGPQSQVVLQPWLNRRPGLNCFRPREFSNRGGESYSANTYAQAVARACVAAGCSHWHPHQLRHAAATRLRATHGIEVAQAVLGHTRTDMTEIYAERSLLPAIKAMEQAG